MSTIYTLIGLPASGKSTFAKEMEKRDCVVVSTDAIRKELFGSEECQDQPKKVFQLAYARVQDALNKGQDIVFDATNISRKARKNILKFNAEHIAILFLSGPKMCKIRNAQRERVVPDIVIDRMYKKYQKPTTKEGFNTIIEIL